MIAHLPMYDLPAIRAGTDQLWAMIRDGLRDAGIDAPDQLTRNRDIAENWASPDLLLGQTCSLPYRLWVHRKAYILGAFDYGLNDTAPGDYHSVYVAHSDDPRSQVQAFRGARLAYNSGNSESGWGVVWTEDHELIPQIETGAHLESAYAVIACHADIASIDAVTWRFLQAYHPEVTSRLKEVGRSRASPGLPLITAYSEHRQVLNRVLTEAAQMAPSETRIRGFVPCDAGVYLALPHPPDPSAIVASLDADIL